MNTPKSMPLTRSEVIHLIELVLLHPVVFSKATNVANNQSKDNAWSQITDAFNASVATVPRKPETLRLKWENLKKAARKRTATIRSNNLKTGGGKPIYIAPDDVLDKVAALLGPTCFGYTAFYGGDAVVEVADKVDVAGEMEVAEEVEIPNEVEVFKEAVKNFTKPVSSPPFPTLPETPTPGPSQQKFYFKSAISKGKLKEQAIAADMKAAERRKSEAISHYYEIITKQEEEFFKFKKRKIELEILELERKLDQ